MSIAIPSQAELDAKAKAEADAQIAAASASIQADRDEAARRRAAAQASLQASGEAAVPMLQAIGPRVGAAYNDAATALGQVSASFSDEMKQRIAASQGQNQGFTAGQTGMIGESTIDPTKAADVQHYLGGYIPAGDLASQGAAARTRAEGMPAIHLAAVREGIHDMLNKGSEEDRMYAQELIKIAKEFPELKAAAYEKLFNEATARAKFTNDQETTDRELDVRERAQTLYEKQFGLKVEDYKFDVWLQGKKMKLAEQKQKQAVQKAINEGKKPNAALSAKYGYIVDEMGNAILDGDGRKIKVAASAAKPKAPPAAGEQPYQKAVKEAKTLRGTPVATPSNLVTLGARGRFLARPGAKGVFAPVKDKRGRQLIPATTNNPNMAQRDGDMTFAQAQSYLVDLYGLKPARARAALISAGWRPDGKRP